VKVSTDYDGEIPPGFDVINLAPCPLILFQGESFSDEDSQRWDSARIVSFNPEV